MCDQTYNMEHQSRANNGVHTLQSTPLPPRGNSTGAPVFPGYGQNFASLYSLPDVNEPVNLSAEIASYILPGRGMSGSLASGCPLPHSPLNNISTPPVRVPVDRSIPAMPELTMHQPRQSLKHNNSTTSPSKLPLPVLRRPQSANFKPKPPSTYPLILPFPPSAANAVSGSKASVASSVNINNNNRASSSLIQTHVASASPAIQAALNQPVIGRDRPEVGSKVGASSLPHPKLEQAPTMKRYLSQPPLQGKPSARSSSKQPKQPRRRYNKANKSVPVTQFQSLAPAGGTKTVEEKFVAASQISGTPLSATFVQAKSFLMSDQFAPVSSPRSAMMNSYAGSGENSLLTSETSNDAGPAAISGADPDRFTPVDLRRRNEGEEFILIPPMIELPDAPRSLMDMRFYKKQKSLLLLLPKLRDCNKSLGAGSADSLIPFRGHIQPFSGATSDLVDRPATVPQLSARSKPITVNSSPTLVSSTRKLPSGSQTFHSPTDFDWTLYLKATKSKAAPHSAFKHVEGSLLNGFMVGMKVETPLRDVDTDKYWLATIVGVFGPMLKLRFDGYGDKSKDFIMLCSSGQLHPIGWCARNQKSLLPPADIRHTQKQWKNFLMNALQGAKTVPMYLLSSRATPWIADRIRQGMRLEVQHEHLPTAVWVAKVIRNVGGRMKLRYEGSIDDATDFWLFYFDSRIHPCGWAVEAHTKYKTIYKPPDEIRASYSYEAWTKILREVTSDSNLERIPAEIFQIYVEPTPHNCQVGQLLEAVIPEGTHICPARISELVANSYYFVVEFLEGKDIGRKTCHSRDMTLLSLGWCDHHKVKLGKSSDSFSWSKYQGDPTNRGAVIDPSIVKQRVPVHQFGVGQRLEAANPTNKDQICVANIARITGRLMWLEICTSPTGFKTIIVDVLSQAIFPSGWCESNRYPLISPQLQLAKRPELPSSSGLSENLHGELGPKIYFNHSCFSGPFLSKGRIQQLPLNLGPGYIRLIVKEMLNLIIGVGYKSSYILKTLGKTGNPNPAFHQQVIKTKCKDKNYEGVIDVCTKRSELASYCKEICQRLQCCPNLVSTEKVGDQCNENCQNLTKTQFLYGASRKPGRPSSTNPDGSISRKKKRKRRKKVFTPKRNLYMPKYGYTGVASDNDSVSSNTEEEDDDEAEDDNAAGSSSPGVSVSGRVATPLTPAKSPSAAGAKLHGAEGMVSRPWETAEAGLDNPLFQLQLTSVKKLPTSMEIAATQYQIVKPKRGRPNKQISPEACKRSNSLTMSASKTSHPTVPPLKIRRLDSSPTPQSLEEASVPIVVDANIPSARQPTVTNGPSSQMVRLTSPPTLNGNIPERKTQSKSVTAGRAHVRPKDSARTKGDGAQLLMRAVVPHSLRQSALAFTRPRRYIDEKDKVMLIDNPLYWDVDRLVTFVKETDCGNLAQSLLDQEVDGASFMMFVLPTVQEVLELKLGPALKLCHHVERLKLAFFETFHPEEGTREIPQNV